LAIIRMISRDPGSFRAFQQRLTTVGKIRLGVYNGRYPEKIDTFRFTSPDEQLVKAAADAYGGTAEQWTPNGSKTPQWEVISEAKELPVYLVHGQSLEPWYEAWAGGRTCVRRCDGVTNKITDEPCVCIPADGSASPLAKKDLCKPTIRVQVMLQEVPGLGSWLMESHGENAVSEISAFEQLVRAASVPIPAVLRLREETRREWNFDKKKFDTKNFYVPWFDVSVVTSRQVALGGDALSRALQAAGAPAALSGDRRAAIEAAPAPVQPPPDIDAIRPMILADIEMADGMDGPAGLNAIRAKLEQRGIDDQKVKDAWNSKRVAFEYQSTQLSTQPGDPGYEAIVAVETAEPVDVSRPYRVLVTGSRTWTDVAKLDEQLDIANMTHRGRMVLVHGACPTGADALAEAWARKNRVPVETYPADWDRLGKSAGFKRNQLMVDTRPDVVLSFNRCGSNGTEHCTDAAEKAGLKVLRFTDDTLPGRKEPCLNPYCANDLETFCGFTPNQHMEHHGAAAIIEADYAAGRIPDQGQDGLPLDGGPGDGLAVEGTVEGEASPLPSLPEGDYDADELYTGLITGGGLQTPPLTTTQVQSLISKTFGVHHTHASGYQLAQLRAGLKSGAVSWR
jgi:hypothetical protein